MPFCSRAEAAMMACRFTLALVFRQTEVSSLYLEYFRSAPYIIAVHVSSYFSGELTFVVNARISTHKSLVSASEVLLKSL
jgi:hypothetical protein